MSATIATQGESALDYCLFLSLTKIIFTNTYLAHHSIKFNHDAVNRSLKNSKITTQ